MIKPKGTVTFATYAGYKLIKEPLYNKTFYTEKGLNENTCPSCGEKTWAFKKKEYSPMGSVKSPQMLVCTYCNFKKNS